MTDATRGSRPYRSTGSRGGTMGAIVASLALAGACTASTSAEDGMAGTTAGNGAAGVAGASKPDECQPGTPSKCNDGNECTADACIAQKGCSNTPVADGTLCNRGQDVCLGGMCQQGCQTDGDCNDNDACNGVESCVDFQCESGTPLVCDNGNECDGVETCEPATGCQAGTPPSCAGASECTADSCDAQTGCNHTPVQDGTRCNSGADVCVAGTCQAGCTQSSECNDNDVCNGVESCVDFQCQAGTALRCNDGIACNGVEGCDPATGCTPGTAPKCTSPGECATGQCVEPSGCKVQPLPSGTACSTGVCDGAGTCALRQYSAGHADLAMEFEVVNGELEVFLEAEAAVIDGAVTTEIVPIEAAQVVSDATFTRPDPDFDLFQNLCVANGATVQWLPQSNADAAACDVPFLGVASEVLPGTFVGDQIRLSLLGVVSPSGAGHYSVWKDGFPPVFSMASCDGVDPSVDLIDLPIGHDHFNMGFTEPGEWQVQYEVSGDLVAGGKVSTAFNVNFLMQDRVPACGK